MREMTQASLEHAMVKIMGDSQRKLVRLFCHPNEFVYACYCLEGWEKMAYWDIGVIISPELNEGDWKLSVFDDKGSREYPSS